MRSVGQSNARATPPVLFLTDVGLTAAIGLRCIAELAPHFQVIASPLVAGCDDTLDGEPSPTTPEGALALLNASGIERAHIVGLSFGGVIAQEIAIHHPERVCSLVLGATSAGGDLYVPPERAIPKFVRRLSGLPAEEGLWASVPYLYAAATCRGHARRIGEDIAQRLRAPLDPRYFRREHDVARIHDASARLTRISAPTLVLHGEQDRIVPPGNGRLLASGIPRAQFVRLRDAAHAFLTDVPDASGEIVSFLLNHSPSRPGRPAKRNARAGRA